MGINQTDGNPNACTSVLIQYLLEPPGVLETEMKVLMSEELNESIQALYSGQEQAVW